MADLLAGIQKIFTKLSGQKAAVQAAFKPTFFTNKF